MTGQDFSRSLGELLVLGHSSFVVRHPFSKKRRLLPIERLSEVLPHRNVRDQDIGHILNRAVIAALKSLAVRIRAKQRASLVDQRFPIAVRGFIRREQFVDLHDEPGQRMQPREPWVVEHEPQQRTRPLDPPLLTLVPNTGIVEQRLVHAEEAAPNIVELLSYVRR